MLTIQMGDKSRAATVRASFTVVHLLHTAAFSGAFKYYRHSRDDISLWCNTDQNNIWLKIKVSWYGSII